MSGKIPLLPYPFFYKEVRFSAKPIPKRCRGQVNFMCQQLMADEAGSNDVSPTWPRSSRGYTSINLQFAWRC